MHFDAILIPGGGLTRSGELTQAVRARLDLALAHTAALYIPLSAGTPHAPPPLDARGYPIWEAIPAAHYLQSRGIAEERIATEVCSYDTIGNAFFSRVVHTDPLGLRRLLIVNSEFHMPRTEAIFRWIFGAAPAACYELAFESCPNVGISAAALEQRAGRERASIEKVRELAARIRDLPELHRWLFSQHGAYAWQLRESAYRPMSGALAETYGGE